MGSYVVAFKFKIQVDCNYVFIMNFHSKRMTNENEFVICLSFSGDVLPSVCLSVSEREGKSDNKTKQELTTFFFILMTI